MFFSTSLTGGRKYYLDFDPGAISDYSNNWFTDFSNPFDYSVTEFTKGDYFFTSALADADAPGFPTSDGTKVTGFKPDNCQAPAKPRDHLFLGKKRA